MYQGTTVGDTLYWDGTNWVIVPAHVAATLALLRQTGTGSAGGVPTWDTTHGSAQHDSTTYLGGRYIVDNIQKIQPRLQGTQVGAVGRVYFTFIDIPRPCTLDAIGFSMVTKGGAGTNYRLGIYPTVADIPDGQAVLFDSGNISAVPANIGLTENAVNQVIATAGLYALCLETADATISFFRYSPAADPDNVLVAKAWGCRYDRGGGYGALTTPCPVTTADKYAAPQMFVRVGSWQG